MCILKHLRSGFYQSEFKIAFVYTGLFSENKLLYGFAVGQ